MVRVKRGDLKGSVCLVKGRWAKPDLHRVDLNGQTFTVKDVAGRGFLFRWTIGRWLIQNEWKIYARLKGITGVPRPVGKIDRFAFAIEYVPGSPIRRGEDLPSSFFDDLAGVLREIHSRGVVHLDLRHKGNVLISEDGKPFIIDFNSSLSFGERGWLRRLVFPALRWVDYGGLLKLKQRVSPFLMTPEESSFLKRFNLVRRFWIFN